VSCENVTIPSLNCSVCFLLFEKGFPM
jgi:hypothetical protein